MLAIHKVLWYNNKAVNLIFGGIAQLARVPAWRAGGHRFEPYCLHQKILIRKNGDFYFLPLHYYLLPQNISGAALPPIVNARLHLALFVLRRYKHLPSGTISLDAIFMRGFKFVQKMQKIFFIVLLQNPFTYVNGFYFLLAFWQTKHAGVYSVIMFSYIFCIYKTLLFDNLRLLHYNNKVMNF